MLLIEILLFANVILLSLATTSSIQEQVDRLSAGDQARLVQHLQNGLAERNLPLEAAENWCCRIEPGVQATTQTREVTFYVRHSTNPLDARHAALADLDYAARPP